MPVVDEGDAKNVNAKRYTINVQVTPEMHQQVKAFLGQPQFKEEDQRVGHRKAGKPQQLKKVTQEKTRKVKEA